MKAFGRKAKKKEITQVTLLIGTQKNSQCFYVRLSTSAQVDICFIPVHFIKRLQENQGLVSIRQQESVRGWDCGSGLCRRVRPGVFRTRVKMCLASPEDIA